MIKVGASIMPARVDDGGAAEVGGNWPPEVHLIVSAMEAGSAARPNRRRGARRRYQQRAVLRLFSDSAAAEPRTIYTRDINARGMGFVTPHRLPLGYGGVVKLPLPDGRPMEIHCTLLRCRETVKGWFEGAVYFNRPQPVFEEIELGVEPAKLR